MQAVSTESCMVTQRWYMLYTNIISLFFLFNTGLHDDCNVHITWWLCWVCIVTCFLPLRSRFWTCKIWIVIITVNNPKDFSLSFGFVLCAQWILAAANITLQIIKFLGWYLWNLNLVRQHHSLPPHCWWAVSVCGLPNPGWIRIAFAFT